MEHTEPHCPIHRRDNAVADALLAPGEGSFVDALLALADEAANGNGPQRAISNGFQAALAQRMRRSIRGESERQSAA